MGRPAIGDRAMTGAERKRKQRARHGELPKLRSESVTEYVTELKALNRLQLGWDDSLSAAVDAVCVMQGIAECIEVRMLDEGGHTCSNSAKPILLELRGLLHRLFMDARPQCTDDEAEETS
jgi:hypothetical protein